MLVGKGDKGQFLVGGLTPAVPASSVCTRKSRKFAIMVGLLCRQIAKVWRHLFLRNWDLR